MGFLGPWEPEYAYSHGDVVEYRGVFAGKTAGIRLIFVTAGVYYEIVQPHTSQVYHDKRIFRYMY
jgi:hypothetical protein